MDLRSIFSEANLFDKEKITRQSKLSDSINQTNAEWNRNQDQRQMTHHASAALPKAGSEPMTGEANSPQSMDELADDEELLELIELPSDSSKHRQYNHVIRPIGARHKHVKQSPNWQRKHLAAVISIGCCRSECLTKFNVADMLQYVMVFGQLNEESKSQAIRKSLIESITTNKKPKSRETHTVAGLLFNFSWQGVSLCPRAFAALHSISYHKLTAVVESIAAGSSDPHIGAKFKAYQETVNNEASEILNFLNYLKHMYGYSTADTDSITWLRDITLKSEVYEMLCEDYHERNQKPPTLAYFYSVWKRSAPNIIPEGLTVVCSECIKLHADIASPDAECSSEAVEKLNNHMARQKALRELYERLRVEARQDSKILVLIGDHMRSKFLPKFTRQTQQSLMTQLFEFAVSGWHNCRTLHTDYFLFGEHFKESSDTIISCLHAYLKANYMDQEQLYLVFDRHSTQANNLLMGYLEWLVRFKKMFSKITVVFLESGHTKTILDAEHKNIAKVYYANEIFSIEEYVKLIAKQAYRHKASWFTRLYDFEKLFTPVLQPIPQLLAAHIYEITKQGTTTKIHPNDPPSEWRGMTTSPNKPAVEPFFFLAKEPTGDLTALQPTQAAFDSIVAKASKIIDLLTAVPLDRTSFLRSTLAGELGYDLNYKEIWVGEATQPKERIDEQVDKQVDEKVDVGTPQLVGDTREWTVTSVFDRKFAINDDNTVVCLFKAVYRLDDGTEQTEWQARENFSDRTDTGRQMNKAYETYEHVHPYRGKNQSQLRIFEKSKQPLLVDQIQKFHLKNRHSVEGPVKQDKRKHVVDDETSKQPSKKQRK